MGRRGGGGGGGGVLCKVSNPRRKSGALATQQRDPTRTDVPPALALGVYRCLGMKRMDYCNVLDVVWR